MRLAGIVLFNPDLERLRQNICACVKQVDEIICIDNGSKNITEVEKILEEIQKTINYKDTRDAFAQTSHQYSNEVQIKLIKNQKNLGIAKALNQILYYAKDHEYKWVLSLDQDSVIAPGLLDGYEHIILNWKNIESDKCSSIDNKLSMLTALYQDRNSTLKMQAKGDYEEVKECITSASYANVQSLLSVGGYDEKMFIDFVDYDMCATLRENGYKIIRMNKVGLIHEVGKARTVNLFGIKTNVHNESAFRKYYQSRNHLYFIKKHRKSIDKFVEYRRVLKLYILTLLYEDDKWNKIKAMLKGVRDSQYMTQELELKAEKD